MLSAIFQQVHSEWGGVFFLSITASVQHRHGDEYSHPRRSNSSMNLIQGCFFFTLKLMDSFGISLTSKREWRTNPARCHEWVPLTFVLVFSLSFLFCFFERPPHCHSVVPESARIIYCMLLAFFNSSGEELSSAVAVRFSPAVGRPHGFPLNTPHAQAMVLWVPRIQLCVRTSSGRLHEACQTFPSQRLALVRHNA